mmetsp:Transcript_11966/g.46648  ORF Transcript_11966/g.46648 Transcript_11966/m.46648 type:complete len:315 (+) Transcript_11966:106-1050(+)
MTLSAMRMRAMWTWRTRTSLPTQPSARRSPGPRDLGRPRVITRLSVSILSPGPRVLMRLMTIPRLVRAFRPSRPHSFWPRGTRSRPTMLTHSTCVVRPFSVALALSRPTAPLGTRRSSWRPAAIFPTQILPSESRHGTALPGQAGAGQPRPVAWELKCSRPLRLRSVRSCLPRWSQLLSAAALRRRIPSRRTPSACAAFARQCVRWSGWSGAKRSARTCSIWGLRQRMHPGWWPPTETGALPVTTQQNRRARSRGSCTSRSASDTAPPRVAQPPPAEERRSPRQYLTRRQQLQARTPSSRPLSDPARRDARARP